ncbi:MAG: hypothetical protein ACLTEF_05380 [[Clostridium] leptum]
MGHPEIKIKKSQCKNEKGATPNLESSYFEDSFSFCLVFLLFWSDISYRYLFFMPAKETKLSFEIAGETRCQVTDLLLISWKILAFVGEDFFALILQVKA